ncbi:unnamed protein product [Rodentolepis nana]|uniref:CNOT1_CAF1_bind domain-containing protein n=1 Tax=Rodentolepis nana TaxID=102285 RepID=A0A0R3TUA9_RODNA|nr:unnamed protein product [Rodentolepis nana]
MSNDETQIQNHRRDALKASAIHDIVENIDSFNIEAKTENLLALMKRRDVVPFLEAVVKLRVPKDDLNSELLANLVKRINRHFPGTREWAVLEGMEIVKDILIKLPKIGFDSGKAMDLRNLGRFLGLLIRHDIDFDIVNQLREAMRSSTDDLRYVVPFVCQFLSGGASIPMKFKILKLLKLIHDKDSKIKEVKSEIELLFETLEIDMHTFPSAKHVGASGVQGQNPTNHSD